MHMEYIPKQAQKTTEWSGGTTTELYLYPPEGDYAARAFTFRLSTAVCRDETAVFTPLKDTKRILMVLSGGVSLLHEKKEPVTLSVGAQDTFDGGIKTTSYGTCTDYNLMLRKKAAGELALKTLSAGERIVLLPESDFIGIYLFSGKGFLYAPGRDLLLRQRDFCMLQKEGKDDKEAVILSILEDSTVVLSKINGEEM